MARSRTGFTAIENGFRFKNDFPFRFPIQYQLPFGSHLDLNQLADGLCGGICFSALDYFYGKQTPPQDEFPDKLNARLFTYLCHRHLDSLNNKIVIKTLDWMLSEDRVIYNRIARYEIPKLLRMLDQGQPAVLFLLRVDAEGGLVRNHQVVAADYQTDEGTGLITVFLYDPNYPLQETQLIIQRTPAKAFLIRQSTGENNRGFFVISYKACRTFPKPVPEISGLSFAAAQPAPGFRLQWPVDSRVVNQYFGENPDLYRPFKLAGHEGIDLFGLTGANVYACADGEVFQSEHPGGHPYGLQIRIRHEFNGQVFHTIYAHLAQSFVKKGQKVRAGQRIGLVDNTGNSFGSHLHLTLKLEGASTKGYPEGIIDPWPYLQGAVPPADEPPPSPSGVTVYTTVQLNLRDRPSTDAPVLASLPVGEALAVLGDAESIKKKIGVQNEWLQIQTAAGLTGFVAAWLVQDTQMQAFPPSGLIVYPTCAVNMRSGPGTGFPVIAGLSPADPLSVLGDADSIRPRIGRQNEWLQVQTQGGSRGFVAAWLVHLTGQVPPPSGLTVRVINTLNVRARPAADANILTNVTPLDVLTVLGSQEQALASIGKEGSWLQVRTPDKFIGYVAAWLVQLAGDSPPPAEPGGSKLLVVPAVDLNLRAQAASNAPRVGGAFRGEVLEVIEPNIDLALSKIGKQNAWLFIQKQDGTRGWAAAWFLSKKTSS